ncbi:iron complex outermembrane receptor protein [Sphingomonas sp. PP-F2F-A104-K0414]|uniref:TonB-dependent receptor n=1 Tax=Sphingomonas sp. PP-F2F-A104-K0414 TaxID=2135661 RepID=UPI00104A5E19|nr:TonB-dependent receptor [Sphingomonas sp. PP-F2F-A104-K0414]TCP95866.1 iron complex outermembrane receptor protein [Sphingomonas sp. PP-F2F-A104-K0414]
MRKLHFVSGDQASFRPVKLRAELLATALLVACLAAAPSHAQTQAAGPQTQSADPQIPAVATSDPDETTSAVGDIVVTANRRSETVQRVPISITAYSGTQMKQLGLYNASDIAKFTPAVSISQASPASTSINVRGVSQNNFSDHLEAPIAVYMDDAYIGSNGAISVPVYDMQRIEILRGPQGTLFGRNATGGLVQYISNGPSDHFEAYAEVSGGAYEYGKGFFQSEGAISGPLSDTVRARLSVATSNDAGPFHNGIGKDPGKVNEYAARLQLEADLDSRTVIKFIGNVDLTRNSTGPGYASIPSAPDADGLGVALGPNGIGTYANLAGTTPTVSSPCPGCELTGYKPGPNPFKGDNVNPGFFRRSIYGATIKLTHEFDGAELSSVSNYQNISKSVSLSSDASPSYFFYNYGTQQRYHQFSQELRVSGSSEKLKWVAGLYYLSMTGRYGVDGFFDLGPYIGATCTVPACITTGSPVQDFFRADYRMTDRTYSGFAQADYYITPKFFVTAGLRYTSDHKVMDYAWKDTLGFQTILTGGAPTVNYNPATAPSADRHFRNVSAKAQLNYVPREGVLLYAGYTRGHKGGNWSTPIFPPIDVPSLPHKQEVLTSYEAGTKLRFLDGKATLNVSGFYYDYKDYQAFAITGLIQKIFNVDANLYGGEAEFRINPTKGLDIAVNGALLHTVAKDVPLPVGRLADRRFPDASKLMMGGLVRYSFSALDGKVGTQATVNYVGGHYLTVLNEPVNYQKAYVTSDLRLDYAPDGGQFTAALFVRNVTNNFHRVFGLDVAALSYTQAVYAPPRTFGATIGWKY